MVAGYEDSPGACFQASPEGIRVDAAPLIIPIRRCVNTLNMVWGQLVTEDEVKEILKGEFTLDIPNFEKWNAPARGKRQWVKVDNHWQHDPKVRGLAPSYRLGYMGMLNLRGGSHGPITGVSRGSLVGWLNLPGTSPEALIAKLVNNKLLLVWKTSTDREIDREIEGKQKPAAENSPELTPKNLEILRKEFGEKLVEEHLKSALATWEAYEPYRQSQILPIQTVQRYLRNVKKDEAKADKTKSAEEVIAAAWKKLEPPRV